MSERRLKNFPSYLNIFHYCSIFLNWIITIYQTISKLIFEFAICNAVIDANSVKKEKSSFIIIVLKKAQTYFLFFFLVNQGLILEKFRKVYVIVNHQNYPVFFQVSNNCCQKVTNSRYSNPPQQDAKKRNNQTLIS